MGAIQDGLTILNRLREAQGKLPLRTWKDSAAKLAAAIEKLQPAIEQKAAATEPKKKSVGAVGISVKKKNVEGAVGPKTFAHDLKTDEKNIRAKLRRLKAAGADLPKPLTEKGWLFNKTDVARVEELLRADHRKSA